MRGIPNPITKKRNLEDNPVHKPGALEKMRASLTGKKQPRDAVEKRAASLRKLYATNPEAKKRLAKNVWDKYTSKIAGTGWGMIRLKVLERDNYTCQNCGETNRKLLVVHHKDYRGRNMSSHTLMNNKLDNLITWCHDCHNKFHRHKAKNYKERMQRLQDDNPL
jgi:5-methylcytosine-specific restriction endonuclease McrA